MRLLVIPAFSLALPAPLARAPRCVALLVVMVAGCVCLTDAENSCRVVDRVLDNWKHTSKVVASAEFKSRLPTPRIEQTLVCQWLRRKAGLDLDRGVLDERGNRYAVAAEGEDVVIQGPGADGRLDTDDDEYGILVWSYADLVRWQRRVPSQ
jgi:hypothetical protein